LRRKWRGEHRQQQQDSTARHRHGGHSALTDNFRALLFVVAGGKYRSDEGELIMVELIFLRGDPVVRVHRGAARNRRPGPVDGTQTEWHCGSNQRSQHCRSAEQVQK
jgi:hypothetical protein